MEGTGGQGPKGAHPGAPKKKGGLWKWFACGCALLLALVLLAAGIAGFLAYKGVLFAKKKGAEAVRRLEQREGLPPVAGRLEREKMAAFFRASDRWPAIQEAVDAGNRTALDEEARRLGFRDGQEVERYMAVVTLSGTMTFLPEKARREMLTQSVGPEVAEVILAPANQEKIRRFLNR
jgi:hypothetical protein